MSRERRLQEVTFYSTGENGELVPHVHRDRIKPPPALAVPEDVKVLVEIRCAQDHHVASLVEAGDNRVVLARGGVHLYELSADGLRSLITDYERGVAAPLGPSLARGGLTCPDCRHTLDLSADALRESAATPWGRRTKPPRLTL